jgi:sugar phosphate isomerase/epimerase
LIASAQLSLGVANGLVPIDPGAVNSVMATKLQKLGISRVVTHFAPPPEVVRGEVARRVRSELREHGIRVVQASGYNPNMIDPDRSTRHDALGRLRAALYAARDLGAQMVISGCGSMDPSFFYGPDPRNRDERTKDRLVDFLQNAVSCCEETGVPIALEPHVLTTLCKGAVIREVIERVGSEFVRCNFDPTNLLGDLDSVFGSAAYMERLWDEVAPYWMGTAHLKDIVVESKLVLHIREVPPGEGVLDLDTFFRLCKRFAPGGAVIVEHLNKRETISALRVVRELARRNGVEFVSD